MMKLKYSGLVMTSAVLLSVNAMAGSGAPIKGTKSAPPKKFIDRANMDLSVKPGDNFFEYANGTWLKNNTIPAKETSWGSFMQLRDFNINAVQSLLKKAEADKNAAPGSIEKRVGDFYAAGMDSVTIEKLGYSPIKPDMEKINQIKDLKGVLDEVAYMRTNGIGSPMFGFGIGQDSKNPNQMVVNLRQGGTSLPDRDYYLKSDARVQKIQTAYKNYITTLFTLTGTDQATAQKNAETVFNIEKALATAQMTRLELRNPQKTYNKFAVADFNKTTPTLNWVDLMAKMKVTGQDSVLVGQPKFFTDLNGLLTATSVADWKTYLQWNLLRNSASLLSSPFVKAGFAYSQVLSGQKVQTPRWQRMSSATDGTVGELLGQLYVKEYFTPEAKARMEVLVSNLRKAYAIRISKLDWMSDATKQKALAKLNAFTPKIGYPNHWETYTGLEINRNTYFQNVRNASKWGYDDNVKKLGKPVDRTLWGMTPPTVNAYYSPVMNEIVFPAGILQFPFFDPNADDAVNYGGIGAVIGHEMSHGFDDQGSQYDKDGTLRNWWTAEDRKKFEAKTGALGQQFDAYTILDTIHVNGKLTMGENIGDLGGLNVAYTAFKLTKQGQGNEKIDGFTPDQRFFLSWAQVWRGKMLSETAAQQVVTDPHSPTQYRAIGAPVNMDAWYTAFDVKPGDKLYKKPEDRIRMW
ncbi:MAG: M13 family metallopeptidase [Janthinobacterium lividum]